MRVAYIKQLLDACYLAKRARDLLPALPEGVLPSYIQYLDAIGKLEAQGLPVKVSDLSREMNLPRPGVPRTVKEMEAKGYLTKQVSAEDGRVTYLSRSEAGKALSQKYDGNYFQALAPYMGDISDAEAESAIRTIEKFYRIMCERRDSLEQR